MSVSIRPYRPADRAPLRAVCLATGLRGRDIRQWLDHREIWADIWTAAYTDREPENCWVVCDDGTSGSGGNALTGTLRADAFVVTPSGVSCSSHSSSGRTAGRAERPANPLRGPERVVGYLVATADTESADRYFTRRVLPRIAGRAIFCGHWLSSKDRTFFARTIRAMRRGELALPAGVAREYPGHFHFNLLDGYRGAGLGSRLYELFVARMGELGVGGVHGQVMTANHPVVGFHQRRGYTEVFRGRSESLSNYFEQGDVELAVFVKKL